MATATCDHINNQSFIHGEAVSLTGAGAPRQLPLQLKGKTIMLDEGIHPLIKRLNSTCVGVCTMGSHQGTTENPARFYFKYSKYKDLMDSLQNDSIASWDESDPENPKLIEPPHFKERMQLIKFFEDRSKFDAWPCYWAPMTGVVIYVHMRQSDVPVLCDLWDKAFPNQCDMCGTVSDSINSAKPQAAASSS